jgi:hypothetical protein
MFDGEVADRDEATSFEVRDFAVEKLSLKFRYRAAESVGDRLCQ